MLRNKVFGAYESDLEFQLVHFSSMPLYKEVFDPDAALKGCLDNVYVAESHSESIRWLVGKPKTVEMLTISRRLVFPG